MTTYYFDTTMQGSRSRTKRAFNFATILKPLMKPRNGGGNDKGNKGNGGGGDKGNSGNDNGGESDKGNNLTSNYS